MNGWDALSSMAQYHSGTLMLVILVPLLVVMAGMGVLLYLQGRQAAEREKIAADRSDAREARQEARADARDAKLAQAIADNTQAIAGIQTFLERQGATPSPPRQLGSQIYRHSNGDRRESQ